MAIWTGLLVFVGLALVVVVWRVIDPPPRLRIGQQGILDRNLGWGWIPWSEIEGAYPPTLDHAETLRLQLRVTERLERVLRRRRRAADAWVRRSSCRSTSPARICMRSTCCRRS